MDPLIFQRALNRAPIFIVILTVHEYKMYMRPYKTRTFLEDTYGNLDIKFENL